MIYLLNIYIEDLGTFSLNDRLLYTFIIVSGILISFFMIKPFVSLLISTQSFYLINYVISSLFVLFVFLITVLLNDKIWAEATHLFKFILQVLAVFGIILSLKSLGHYIYSKIKT